MDRYDYPYINSPTINNSKNNESKNNSASKTMSNSDRKQQQSFSNNVKTATPTDIEKQLRRLESELKVAQQIPMGGAHVNFREQRILKKKKKLLQEQQQEEEQQQQIIEQTNYNNTILPPPPSSPDTYAFKHISLPEQVVPYLEKNDFIGGLTMLKFIMTNNCIHEIEKKQYYPWVGYFEYHAGHFQAALDIYLELEESLDSLKPPYNYVHIALCYFHLEKYHQTEKIIFQNNTTFVNNNQKKKKKKNMKQRNTKHENQKEVDDDYDNDDAIDIICNRILFHTSFRLKNDDKLIDYHEQLQTDVMEDQLSLAAMHFLRGHYQEATNIYKQILISNHTVVAINVYLALCYYKLEYYDVSLELLDAYLKQYPNSLFALNLKACNHFNLYNGRAAELVLKPYLSNTTTISSNIGTSIYGKNDLIENNMVVFRNGSQALKILLPLSDYLNEAKLNLIIYYIKENEFVKAFKIVENMNEIPIQPVEYVIKGIAYASYGEYLSKYLSNNNNSKPPSSSSSSLNVVQIMNIAKELFTTVGASSSECKLSRCIDHISYIYIFIYPCIY